MTMWRTSTTNHKGLLAGVVALAILAACSTEKVDNASLQKALVKNAGLSEGQASCLTEKLSSGLTPSEFQKVALAGKNDDLAKIVGEDKAADVEKWMVACIAPNADTAETAPAETVVSEPAVDTTVVAETTAPPETEPATTAPRSQDNVALNTAVDVSNGWTATVLGYDPDATAAVLAANQFNTPPPAGQRFVTIRVAATFNGRSDAQKSTVSDLSFKAVGAKGLAYNSYDCGASLDTPLETFSDVFAGATTEGDICFLVDDADADTMRLYIETFNANFDTITTFFALV
jgi:hypothetical protein